jgi:hypothetical protein
MANIINEIPAELEDDETTEVELESKEDNEDYEEAVEAKKEEQKAKKESKSVQEELDFDLEIEDDTPPEDRNRDPLPDEIKEELEKDTLEDYSERVKNRMAQLKKVWHDERRAKEAADRERAEAVAMAQRIIEENKKLKTTLSTGEEDYLKTLKDAYDKELALAKREYREAYDSGDPDKISEAQSKISEAQYKLLQAQQIQPQYSKEALQAAENSVQIEQQRNLQTQAPRPDEKTLAWQAKNSWFGPNRTMTGFALGLHDQLVNIEGVSPSSDDYFKRIDKAMRETFPNYFGETESLEEDKPAQRTTKPSTVVAPATRSTSPKKVRLTKTQLALAKKFKLTPEQYAKELLKTENVNG